MSTSSRINLSGFAELEQSLSNLSKATGRGVLRRSLRKAAEPMRALAAEKAAKRTGGLSKSVKIGTTLNGSQKKKHRSLSNLERSAVELFVGPSYLKGDGGNHGHLVEFGTKPRINKGKFAGTKHPGTAPQPFMRPAFHAEAKPTIDRLKGILWDEIQKATKRQAKKDGWEV